jgi:anti-sigma regulatory factor (Ser/Thr protein kinase)
MRFNAASLGDFGRDVMQVWSCELLPVLEAIRPTALKFREWIEQCAERRVAADCELALVEACNNLVIHGNAREPICIRAEVNAVEIVMSIVDKTKGFAWPDKAKLPEADEDHGRGIFLIQTLMTEVQYHREDGWNELRLRRLV